MRTIVGLFLLLSVMVNLNGCYALRKKFTRKPKKEESAPLYLDLKEYPKVPTRKMYHQYYLFVRGWLEELKRSIEENISSKRQKKSIDQAVKNFEQIMYYYNEEGKEAAAPMHSKLVKLRKKVYDPYFSASSNFTYVLRDISRIKREFENNFTYDDASEWIKQEQD